MHYTLKRWTTKLKQTPLAFKLVISLFYALFLGTQLAQAQTKVIFITNEPSNNARSMLIARSAQAENVELKIVTMDNPADRDQAIAELHSAQADTSMIVISSSRYMDIGTLRQLLTDERLTALKDLPRIERVPQETIAVGLSEPLATQLATYFQAGRSNNFRNFFSAINLWHQGGDLSQLPKAALPPATGVYHPDYRNNDGLEPNMNTYLRWAKNRLPSTTANNQAVIGIDTYYNNIASETTAVLDYMIRNLENQGAIPVVFFHEAADSNYYEEFLMQQGKSRIDILINTRLVYHQSDLKDHYQKLNIPVLQAMSWWQGDEKNWREDKVGISMGFVPLYLVLPEQAGVQDPILTTVIEDGAPVPVNDQVDALLDKSIRLAKLRHTPNAQKNISVMFYNYPQGEKNLSASFLNVPRSLEKVLAQLKEAGYSTEALTEDALIEKLTALLSMYYQQGESTQLLEQGLADFLPLSEYQQYFATLPQEVQERITQRWGTADKSAMALTYQQQLGFAIPRLKVGNVTLMPQPPRGEQEADKEKALYHDTKTPPTHFYLATYYWMREKNQSDALIHFGTHGSQEWMPGKERGLSVFDDPLLVLKDIPVIYPFIVDNIGEATQAKRRGRAVIISHQTPPFRISGLHTTLQTTHDLIHQYQSADQGAVRNQLQKQITEEVLTNKTLQGDLGLTEQVLQTDFDNALQILHDHLHVLAQQAQPLGLHTFSKAPEETHRLFTVLQSLGDEFIKARLNNNLEDYDEFYTGIIEDSAPWQWLVRHVQNGKPLPANSNAADREMLELAQKRYTDLGATEEFPGLLKGLAAEFLDVGYGGDPIRNPDSLPTGRNMYGFDPSKVPTPAAWEAGKVAFQQLYDAHVKENGEPPKKLAFSLWSIEAMRHFGVLEAQVLYAMGVEPVWSRGGNVTGIRIIDRKTLGRPRVDVIASATGLYRDQFPHVFKLIAEATELVSKEQEEDNAVALNSFRLLAEFKAKGIDEETAKDMALTRVFTSETGSYGTGLNDATLSSDTWEKDDKLANLYLERMQYGYGPNQKRWGSKSKDLNLFSEQLKGTDGAVLSRSSNLYGMLTTDDPFQYLGGLSLAVRNLTGKSPKLYISNLRNPKQSKVESAAQFLATELQTRQFHPEWIKALQQEGYAGTLELVDNLNNFWGWNVMDKTVVRDDQWQRFHEVYVNDDLNLGMKEWFEQNNPHAKAQMIERMLEATRKEYWQASDQTLKELVEAWQEVSEKHNINFSNSKLDAYVNGLAKGFGLSADAAPQAATPPAEQPPAEAPPTPEAQPISGQKLEKAETPTTPDKPKTLWLLLIIAPFLAGFGYQMYRKTN